MWTMKCYSAIKRNEIRLFSSTCMDLESVILSEVKSDREGDISYDISDMWNLKLNDTNELTKQKETHRPKMNSWLPGKGVVKDFGKLIYTLLYLKWITNKIPLHSTWNSAQCYVPA